MANETKDDAQVIDELNLILKYIDFNVRPRIDASITAWQQLLAGEIIPFQFFNVLDGLYRSLIPLNRLNEKEKKELRLQSIRLNQIAREVIEGNFTMEAEAFFNSLFDIIAEKNIVSRPVDKGFGGEEY